MRTKLIVGNWKLNKTPTKSIEFMNQFINKIGNEDIDVDWAIAMPSISLSLVNDKVPNSILAAQNVFFENEGAFTGEISLSMLEDVNAKYVIIGHSERRQIFSETNEMINKKVIATLKTKIQPILAFGETEEEFNLNKTKEVITNQIISGLKDVDSNDALKLILAYEPIWAIGTGKTATPEQAQEICKSSREIVTEIFNEEIASKIKILYGGSMNPSNVKELLTQEDIDGGLVGGASLDVEKFYQLITYNK